MQSAHVLLIEDMAEILEDNRRALSGAGYRVSTARTLTQARQRLHAAFPDLIVMDIMLPDGCGVELCRELRAASSVPLIFLTALEESEQIVTGLQAGGDDYLTKPYRMEELLARVEALLRRVKLDQEDELTTGSKRLILDLPAQRAYLDGEDLLLPPKTYQLLLMLVKNRHRFLTADELYASLWALNPIEDSRTIKVHMANLRAKLKQGREPAFTIECRRGQGYRLLLPPDGEA